MTNNTYRTYPYVPSFWHDQDGLLRWTLTLNQSSILSAFLGIFISYALGSLLAILFNAIYISQFHRKTRTLIDDQVVTIGVNTDDPPKLVSYLISFALLFKRRALASTVFKVLILIAFVYFAAQQTMIYFISRLIVNGSVPISRGTCGIPIISGNAPEDQGYYFRKAALIERAATQFEDCKDVGNNIICPGPAGETFSWEVMEIEPSYCWFGPEYCFNGSRTISQRATLVPSDLGTIRNSPISLTVMAECSHVNNTRFFKIGFDPLWNQTFSAYQFGTSPENLQYPLYENDTFVVYDIESLDSLYRFDFKVFNLASYDFNWTAPSFLSDRLDNPYLTDNTTAPSTLYLLFNRINNVASYFRNDDPFFYTHANPNPNNTNLYEPGRIASTMACRDRYELKIKPQDESENGTWTATGQWDYVYKAWKSQKAQDVADVLLFILGMSPSIFIIVFQGMAGNILKAQKTVFDTIQFGNVSTRTEVTRWFGTAMLNALNTAQVYTSDTDNDWGLGIEKFSDQIWFCDKTLRIDPLYVSLYMRSLLLILFGILIIWLIAHFHESLIFLICRIFPKSPTCQWMHRTIRTKNLHFLLQLHRIAVEATSEQRFVDTPEKIPTFEGPGSGKPPSCTMGIQDDTSSESPDGRPLLANQSDESNGRVLSQNQIDASNARLNSMLNERREISNSGRATTF